jgi:Tfp pilus assembly protein PilX
VAGAKQRAEEALAAGEQQLVTARKEAREQAKAEMELELGGECKSTRPSCVLRGKRGEPLRKHKRSCVTVGPRDGQVGGCSSGRC